MSFEELASLLLPAWAGQTGSIIETDERWKPPPPPDLQNDVVVWGRGPLPSGGGLARAARGAAGRERALRSIRRRAAPNRMARISRLPPPQLGGGLVRERLRTVLLGGALVELWKDPPARRVIDEVAEQAGANEPVAGFRPGSGGSVLVRMTGHEGERRLLRAARSDAPADPHRAAEALAAMGQLGLPQIPRLLGRGTAAGASWSTESWLPGRRPSRVRDPVTTEVFRLCTALPRSEEPSTAHVRDLAGIAQAFPQWGTVLGQIGDGIDDVSRAVPSILRHGDLWAGNLLVARGRLTGIVDWDAWHPSALPGTDLLHLVATGEEIRTRRGLGHVWLGEPWAGEPFRSLADDYWAAMRIVPNRPFLRILGISWWASYVAASIHRLPHLASQERWADPNVIRVLQALA